MTIRSSAPGEKTLPNWNSGASGRNSHHYHACRPQGTGKFLMRQFTPTQGAYRTGGNALNIRNMFGAHGVMPCETFFVEIRARCLSVLSKNNQNIVSSID
jgi:hypothetical protein